jgi:hypothetical protein
MSNGTFSPYTLLVKQNHSAALVVPQPVSNFDHDVRGRMPVRSAIKMSDD